ncbi:lysosomal proton-coupled steroid conjugate and bile acid symporter SLC46A3-like isoform X2 [Mytilus galloprovincialis]|uniref:lysosomal proton-coupled steroid conjugate and bile acid symporter SLC46A3-like isoform X2 n=1 Tax=Mytilus galloprovincialis TaxID=29158 RepID=UPI003F7C0972
MDERKQLLTKDARSSWFDVRTKLCIFVMIHGCALEIQSVTETQYVYSYLKKHTHKNVTYESTSNNLTEQNCPGNMTGENDDYIQSLASDWTWYIQLVKYGICLPVLVVAGPLSDLKGAKIVLMYNLMFTILSYAARAYAIYEDLNLYWYVGFSAVEGISGCHYVYHLTCSAVLTNSTKPNKERPFILAVYDAMMGIGMGISQIGVGYVIKFSGYTYPYLASIGCLCLVLILIILTLEDSSSKKTVEVLSLSKNLCVLFSNQNALVSNNIKYLCVYYTIYLFHLLPLSANSTIRLLFILGPPFCWSSVHIGWFTAALATGELVIGTVILKGLLSCFKGYVIAMFGYTSTLASFVLFGFCTADWMIYGATAIGVIRILPIPIIKSILSRMVHSDKQGALFANIYLLEAVCRLGGSTLFNNIYHHTRPIFKGMVFFVMALFPLCAGILLMCVTCRNTQTDKIEIKVEEPTVQNRKENCDCDENLEKSQKEDTLVIAKN